MRTMIVAIGLAIATTAAAQPKPAKPAKSKPLPGGMKIITKDGRPIVQQGTLTAPLRDDEVADYEKIAKAELAPDGKTVEITATRCKGQAIDEVTTVPLVKLQAKLDNANGLVAHGKKQYAVAITKFGAAVQKDPATPAYATNLLAAQVLGKKTALAGQTLMVQARKNPMWFAWRLAVDPDLAPAKTLKGAQDLVAAKPGTATVASLGDNDLATSSIAGGMAALRTVSIGSPGTSEVDVVSLATGKLLVRLPLTAAEDACDGTTKHPCDDAAKARIAERMKLVDSLFATLGFVITPNAFLDVRNGESVTKDGFTISFSDDWVGAEKGSAEVNIPALAGAWAIAILPKGVVVKLSERNLWGCNDGSSRFTGAAITNPTW